MDDFTRLSFLKLAGMGAVGFTLGSCNSLSSMDDIFKEKLELLYNSPSFEINLDERIYGIESEIGIQLTDNKGLKSAFLDIGGIRYDFEVKELISKKIIFNHRFDTPGDILIYGEVINEADTQTKFKKSIYVVPREERIAFFEDYEAYSPGDKYLWFSDLRVFEENGKKYLRAKYSPTNIGSLRFSFRKRILARQAYTLEYSVFFEEGFDFVKGGKLPGLASVQGTTGGGEIHPERWSTRIMWREKGGVEIYVYDQDREKSKGSSLRSEDFHFEIGRWHDIKLFVKVNDYQESNGILALTIDGNEIVRKDDVRLRASNDRGLIEEFLFSTFFGGSDSSWSPPGVVYSRFSDITILKS